MLEVFILYSERKHPLSLSGDNIQIGIPLFQLKNQDILYIVPSTQEKYLRMTHRDLD